MKMRSPESAHAAPLQSLVVLMISLLALITAGCGGSGGDEGTDISAVALPTDTLLNLACEDVGINDETCVLDDSENPFRMVATPEFDADNPDALTKFDLDNFPPGRDGAKARFYLWATALARRHSGENQWNTARALHELFHYRGDPIVQAQAIRAYRSILDNFFESVTFFNSVDPATPLNRLAAEDLYQPPNGWAPLFATPGEASRAMSEWGYIYLPEQGLVFANQ